MKKNLTKKTAVLCSILFILFLNAFFRIVGAKTSPEAPILLPVLLNAFIILTLIMVCLRYHKYKLLWFVTDKHQRQRNLLKELDSRITQYPEKKSQFEREIWQKSISLAEAEKEYFLSERIDKLTILEKVSSALTTIESDRNRIFREGCLYINEAFKRGLRDRI